MHINDVINRIRNQDRRTYLAFRDGVVYALKGEFIEKLILAFARTAAGQVFSAGLDSATDMHDTGSSAVFTNRRMTIAMPNKGWDIEK